MSFLRAPYWRKTWISASYIEYSPSEFSTGLVGLEQMRPSQGALTPYYDDETPSDMTVYAEDPLTDTTDGALYVTWQDNTGGLRHHRIVYREHFSASSQSWWLAAQYSPSRITGEITGLTQAAGYDVGVESIDTADNFLSQRTYVTHTLSYTP